MKISLIIPVFNSERFIGKLMDSILNQSYQNYEIVIVDDGSTDNTKKIIEKYNSDKIKYIYINNSGPGIARKIGFKNSTGELLFFIDSDDFLPEKNILENINNIYNINKFDILLFNFIRKSNNVEKVTNVLFNEKLKEKNYDEKFLKNNRIEGALWGKIFVKDKINENYFCNNKNFEDYYTTYRYLNNCHKIYFTKKVFYYANRDNSDSISKKYDSKKIIDTINLLINIYSFSKYKDVVITIICNYYTFCKINMKNFNLEEKEIKNIELKLKELKKYIKIKSLFAVNHSFKCLLKYIYVQLKDLLWIK